MKTIEKIEDKSVDILIDKIIKGLEKDKRKEYLKIVDLAEKFYGKSYSKEDYDRVRAAINDENNRWVKFIDKVIDETNPLIRKKTIYNLGYNAFLKGTKTIRANRKKYNCNIPWLILFDPTTACNMHCTGCWAGTYGHKFRLSFEDMDKIVTEGKELGVYLYMLTGGEPLVCKKDIIALAKKHNDVEFSIYTNSTLIDEDFCKEIVECGNIVFQLSIEGTEESNDSRRGNGHYKAVLKAMHLLQKYGIIFGTSICYTKYNIFAVTDDKFLKMLADNGAIYSFFFHYMPVGNNAVVDLLPTVEQRKFIIDKIRKIRSNESDLLLFPMDFQNDGEFVGGCIAGGRNYFHINAAGDAEPCVFIHYSDANIHDKSILEILQSPLFMAYHNNQPFNSNHLRPCPMLENPEKLKEIVSKVKAHSTDLESPEEVDHLCSKCEVYAKEWQVVADEIWNKKKHKLNKYENYTEEKIEELEKIYS